MYKKDIESLGFFDELTGGGCVAHMLDLKNDWRLMLTDGNCGYIVDPNDQCYLGLDDDDMQTVAYFLCDNLSEALTIAKVLKKTYGV